MEYILMNKNVPWLLFSCALDALEYTTAQELQWYTEQRPLGYKNLFAFLEARRAPKHRKHIARLLAAYGCDELEGFLRVTHALSLNDTFWVKEAESPLLWEEVSLYRNPFNELISQAAFDGIISETDLPTTSPEFGTDGNYAKCWQREGARILLYKSGSATYEIEPLSEFLASQLCQAICPMLCSMTWGSVEREWRRLIRAVLS